jgi:hypothetical protein
MFSAPQFIAAAGQLLRDGDARIKCNPVRMYARFKSATSSSMNACAVAETDYAGRHLATAGATRLPAASKRRPLRRLSVDARGDNGK